MYSCFCCWLLFCAKFKPLKVLKAACTAVAGSNGSLVAVAESASGRLVTHSVNARIGQASSRKSPVPLPPKPSASEKTRSPFAFSVR